MSEETTVAMLNKYPPDEYNVLAPETIAQVTPWHQITVTQVRLDPDPANGGDVYPQSGKLALTKIGLLKLADAAGVRFGSTKLERTGDDGSFMAYIVAERQDPDGTWRQYPGSYFWDVTERLTSIRDPNSNKGISEARMIRTFAAQRAETGAMSRAIRSIVGVKATYTPREITKPFICARVSFNPFNDPMVRDAYRQALAVKLAENVALMRGDWDADDPLGLDGPAKSTRPTAAQLAAAQETLALLDGRDNGGDGPEVGDTPDLSNATAEDLYGPGDDPPPEPDPPPKKAKQQKLPTTNGKLRPLSAEDVRNLVRWRAGWKGDQRLVDGEPPTQGQVGGLNGLLKDALGAMDDDAKKKARHEVLGYLIGVDGATHLTKREASVLIGWLKVEEEDVWTINEWAATEVARILEAAGIEAGQAPLFDVEEDA